MEPFTFEVRRFDDPENPIIVYIMQDDDGVNTVVLTKESEVVSLIRHLQGALSVMRNPPPL